MIFRNYNLDSRTVKIYVSSRKDFKSLVYINISNSDLGLQNFVHNFFDFIFLCIFTQKRFIITYLIDLSTHDFKITISVSLTVRLNKIRLIVIYDSLCH